MKKISIPLLLLTGLLGVLGCGEDNEADRLIDCHSICDRYAECFDSSYDVSECRESCEDEADADAAFEDRVDDCENCIDGASCTEGTFSCTDDCVGIVP